MDCKFNFVCILYASCNHKDQAENCSLYRRFISEKRPEFIQTETPQRSKFVLFDPYDLNDPTP
jgi:hypothetical protein